MIQDGDIWTNHSKTLLKKVQSDQNRDQENMMRKLESLELSIKDYQNPLDSPITEQELLVQTNKLKPKTACGLDSILNETLKSMNEKLHINYSI